MSTQSISGSLVSGAEAARQALLPRVVSVFTVGGFPFTITVQGGTNTPPDPSPSSPPSPFTPPPPFTTVVATRTFTTTDVAGGTPATTPVTTPATAPARSGTPTPTTALVPSTTVPSVPPPRRTTLSGPIVTNSDSNTLASADSDTGIDSPTPSSGFLTTLGTSILPSAPTESSAGVTVGSAQPKGVPIGVIAGASAAAAVVVLVALGLLCIRRRSRRKHTQIVVNPSDQSPALINVFSDSEPVERIVTRKELNDLSSILHSRSDSDTYHEGSNLSPASPSSDASLLWHGQRGNHPQTQAQPARDSDAHILSPVSIHKSVFSANEIASPGASSVSSAQNIQGIDEQLVKMSSDLPVMAGTGFHQVYREVAMLRREIDELRRSGADVPPAYPGNMNSSQ